MDPAMQACIDAGTPGEMQAWLCESVGTWTGNCTMWTTELAAPTIHPCTFVMTSVFGGRYVRHTMKCEMPDNMGMLDGVGIYAYDNTAKQFQLSWIDNMSTAILSGTGERSSDGKIMNWTFRYIDPATKKLTTMRELVTRTGPDSSTIEMFGPDTTTGKEYRIMRMDLKRTVCDAVAFNSSGTPPTQ